MMKAVNRVLMAVAATVVMAASAAAQGFGPCVGGPGMMGWGGGPGSGPGAAYGRGPGYGPAHGSGAMYGRGPGYGPGAGFAGPRGMMAGPGFNADQRLAYLKSELKLTSAQTAAWNGYEQAVKQQAASMQAFREAMFATQTAEERAALHASHSKHRAAEAETMNAAVQKLYAALTPEQKAIADANLGARFQAMGPRGRW